MLCSLMNTVMRDRREAAMTGERVIRARARRDSGARALLYAKHTDNARRSELSTTLHFSLLLSVALNSGSDGNRVWYVCLREQWG
jgi:hypothetical protein